MKTTTIADRMFKLESQPHIAVGAFTICDEKNRRVGGAQVNPDGSWDVCVAAPPLMPVEVADIGSGSTFEAAFRDSWRKTGEELIEAGKRLIRQADAGTGE